MSLLFVHVWPARRYFRDITAWRPTHHQQGRGWQSFRRTSQGFVCFLYIFISFLDCCTLNTEKGSRLKPGGWREKVGVNLARGKIASNQTAALSKAAILLLRVDVLCFALLCCPTHGWGETWHGYTVERRVLSHRCSDTMQFTRRSAEPGAIFQNKSTSSEQTMQHMATG